MRGLVWVCSPSFALARTAELRLSQLDVGEVLGGCQQKYQLPVNASSWLGFPFQQIPIPRSASKDSPGGPNPSGTSTAGPPLDLMSRRRNGNWIQLPVAAPVQRPYPETPVSLTVLWPLIAAGVPGMVWHLRIPCPGFDPGPGSLRVRASPSGHG